MLGDSGEDSHRFSICMVRIRAFIVSVNVAFSGESDLRSIEWFFTLHRTESFAHFQDLTAPFIEIERDG